MAPTSQMENAAFDQDVEKGELELKSVKMIESNNHITTGQTENNQPNSCQPDVCRKMHERYLEQKSKLSASPWHRLKSIFLLGIITFLILWVITYSVCSWLNLV